MKNKSFRPDFSNPHQNAIVGEFWTGDLSYAYREGFMQATLVLLAAAAAGVYSEPGSEEMSCIYVDAVVYPICFNARHFIELFLKDSIRAVSSLGAAGGNVVVGTTHKISDLWEKFAAVIARDSRLMEFGMPLGEVFKEVADIDDSGATFRYAHDREQNVHLPGIEHINLGVLGDRLRVMFKQAEEFDLCLTYLQQEYGQNTFTGKLNRDNLEAIAKLLPPYERWGDELKPVKAQILEKFGLSSNDFCRALALIKRHREFAGHIGRELALEGLPVDVFARLARVHAGEGYELISKDEWHRLDAVMEMNRPYRFSEEYDAYLMSLSRPARDAGNDGEAAGVAEDDAGGCNSDSYFESEPPRFDPAYLARNAYARNQRLRGGLVKLGQRTLLAALKEAIPHLAEPMKTPPPRSREQIEAEAEEMVKRMYSKGASEPGDETTG